MFLGKAVLKICSKYAVNLKLQSNFIKITLRRGCFPVKLLHISRTAFLKNTSGRLLLLNASYEIALKVQYLWCLIFHIVILVILFFAIDVACKMCKSSDRRKICLK